MTYKIIAIVLAFIAFGFAITAAVYWFKASQVEVLPPGEASIIDTTPLHIMWTQHAMMESSRLNRAAAFFTGVASIFSAAASIFGVL